MNNLSYTQDTQVNFNIMRKENKINKINIFKINGIYVYNLEAYMLILEKNKYLFFCLFNSGYKILLAQPVYGGILK